MFLFCSIPISGLDSSFPDTAESSFAKKFVVLTKWHTHAQIYTLHHAQACTIGVLTWKWSWAFVTDHYLQGVTHKTRRIRFNMESKMQRMKTVDKERGNKTPLRCSVAQTCCKNLQSKPQWSFNINNNLIMSTINFTLVAIWICPADRNPAACQDSL